MLDTIHPHYDVSRNSLKVFLKEALSSSKITDTELLDLVLQDIFNTFTGQVQANAFTDLHTGINGVEVSNESGESVCLIRQDNTWRIEGGATDTDEVISALVLLAYPIQ